MKKICFFIGNLNLTGGTERVTSVLANILDENSYDVSILSIYEGLNPAFEVSNKIGLFQLFSQQVSMKAKFLTSILRLRNFIQDNKIETLIVVDSISCVFTVPALFGLKVNHVCWEHFNFNFNLGSHFRDFGRKIATKYCDYVVTLTNTDRAYWVNYYKNPKAKIVTIYNPSPYKIQETNPRLDSKVALYVGRLSKEKGTDLLLDSWAIVSKQRSDWVLKIVGTGLEENNLKLQCKQLGIENLVSFEGERKDLAPYYRDAKFLCLPSREEGFGMVIVEAYSFGLPVLAFNIETGPKELIGQDTGLLVEPYDIESYSKNILDMIILNEESYNILSSQCKENSLMFTEVKVFSKWKEIL